MPVALPASSPWFPSETSALLSIGSIAQSWRNLTALAGPGRTLVVATPFRTQKAFSRSSVIRNSIRFYTTTIVRQCVLNRFAWGLATFYTGLHEAVSHKYHSWLTQKLVGLTPLVIGIGVARSPPLMEKSENDLIFSLLFSLRNLVSLERFMY